MLIASRLYARVSADQDVRQTRLSRCRVTLESGPSSSWTMTTALIITVGSITELWRLIFYVSLLFSVIYNHDVR
jgi:hypothetical protein